MSETNGTCDLADGIEYYMLHYDIPKVIGPDGTERDLYPNPSRRLFQMHAGRVNHSVWFVRAEDVVGMGGADLDRMSPVVRLVAEMNAAGCDADLIPQHSTARHKIRAAIVRDLRKDDTGRIPELHGNLIKSLAAAHERFEKALAAVEDTIGLDGDDREKLLKKAERDRRASARRALKTAADGLNAAVACAEKFDVTEDVEDLLAGLDEAVQAHRAAFEASLVASKKS